MIQKISESNPVTEELIDQPYVDPVVEAYKKDIDQTILDYNLRLTPQERVEHFMDHLRAIEEFHRAGEKLRQEQREW